jgi:hypothetical protein
VEYIWYILGIGGGNSNVQVLGFAWGEGGGPFNVITSCNMRSSSPPLPEVENSV